VKCVSTLDTLNYIVLQRGAFGFANQEEALSILLQFLQSNSVAEFQQDERKEFTETKITHPRDKHGQIGKA
jgi:hypothetical protein